MLPSHCRLIVVSESINSGAHQTTMFRCERDITTCRILGTKCHYGKIADRLRRGKVTGSMRSPNDQPLQVKAFEAALLAGNVPDKNDVEEIRRELRPLYFYDCVAMDDDEGKECRCNKCVDVLLYGDSRNDEDALEKAFREIDEIMDKIEIVPRDSYSRNVTCSIENLQKKVFEQVLGKELASRVELRFGVWSDYSGVPYDPPEHTGFLYMPRHTSIDQVDSIEITNLDEEMKSPNALERWALIKTVSMLCISDCEEEPSNFLLSRDDTEYY